MTEQAVVVNGRPASYGLDDMWESQIQLQASIDSLNAAITAPDTGLVDRVIAVEVKLDKILEFVAAISQEITPVIDQISAGPVGKMLGLKKKEEGK